jgi:acetolactate synthase-1/2/3 large subunit
VITTYKAKGLLPEDHPSALGGAGLSPKADKLLLPFLAEADCIVLAGYDPIEMRIGWRDPFPPGLPVIELSAVLPTHQMHRADWLLLGDVTRNLEALSANASSKPGIAREKVAALKSALASAFAPEAAWGPGVVFDTIRRLSPREAIATADSGAHRILLSQMWRCYEPRTLLQSAAFCTMGGALPLAMGAQLADPTATVIAFIGDAGFEMGIGELATARDLSLPIIVVVLQDERLALIDLKQRASGRPGAGVAFGRTDFAALAQAFGGQGANVETRAELEAAFSAALARRDRFSVIAAGIAPDAYAGRL